MGKVGSRSIVRSLEASLPDARIEHLHTVTPEGLAAARRASESRGSAAPAYVENGERIAREILDSGFEADVITLVREPVSRNVSAYFQTAVGGLWNPPQERIDELCDEFVEKYPHTQPLQWFAREFDPVYGTTMLEMPFPKALQSREYTSGRFRILLLRCEMDDADKQRAVERFLSLPTMTWVRSNETKAKKHRNVYARFKQRLRLPHEIIDRLYGSTYARHFYSPDEIERFRAKWTSNEATASPPTSG